MCLISQASGRSARSSGADYWLKIGEKDAILKVLSPSPFMKHVALLFKDAHASRCTCNVTRLVFAMEAGLKQTMITTTADCDESLVSLITILDEKKAFTPEQT